MACMANDVSVRRKGGKRCIKNASRAEGFNRHSASGFWRVCMVDKVLRSGKRKP